MQIKRKRKTIIKSDIYKELYEQIGYSRKYTHKLVDSIFHIIRNKLCSNHNVKLSGFGNFLLKDKKARLGRDPKTGEKITIKKRRVVVFHPSPVLRKDMKQ